MSQSSSVPTLPGPTDSAAVEPTTSAGALVAPALPYWCECRGAYWLVLERSTGEAVNRYLANEDEQERRARAFCDLMNRSVRP